MTFTNFAPILIGAVLSSMITLICISRLSEGAKLSLAFKLNMVFLCTLNLYLAFSFSKIPIFYALFGMYLIITAGIDLLTKTIVVSLTVIGGLIGFLMNLLYTANLKDALLGGLIGFCLYFAIYFISKLVYKREAFGFGDVLYITSIGVFLGFTMTILTSMLTFYVALFGIIFVKLMGKMIRFKSEIAFAPFISIAAGIVLYLGQDIMQLYMDFVGL